MTSERKSEEEIQAVEREIAEREVMADIAAREDTVDLDDGRVEVPLRMLAGNMEILLEQQVPCQSVSLKWDVTVPNAVILMFQFSAEDRIAIETLGFQTRPPSRGQ